MTPHQAALLDICSYAFTHGASDIHIEPTANGICIRQRIDGTLHKIKEVAGDDRALFAEHTKQLLGFNMTVVGVPQDARWAHPEEKLDLRGNLMPTRYGEKICLRLLERGKDFSLTTYPLEAEAKAILQRLINKKAGLIVVSGPTGSGKSTLLYSILGSLDRVELNVCTVEDPIEYELAGINQTAIEPRKSFSFAAALRALMRQDPDVIMIGEVRDRETATAAIHAACTGHLVLTTVHANSAAEILTRLEGLGIERGLVESVLLFASAQRLAKTLCPVCKTEAKEAGMMLARMFRQQTLDVVPYTAAGCEHCHHRGTRGRTLVFEYLHKDEEKKITQVGSLKDAAFALVQEGEISANEAYALFS